MPRAFGEANLRWIGLLLALGLTAAGKAFAGTPFPVRETCAVGGERFTYITTGSYTIFGLRPDGRPYGSWTFPLALPVCPKNGLVMYRDFTKAELARLPALLSSPDFQALRSADTPYYRAAWLQHALGGDVEAEAWLLLYAVWETDGDLERQARYSTAFVAAAAQAPRHVDQLTWLALQVRAVNALRELGRFDEAAQMLTSLPRDALTAPPKPPINPEGKPRDEEADRAAWREFMDKLAVVIARGDRSKEPLDLLATDIAAQLCLGADEVSPRTDTQCSAPPLAEAVAALKAERDKYK